MFRKVLLFIVLWYVSVDCKIEHLSNEDELSNMVDLSNMGITRLKNHFLNSSTATHLDLSNNNIFKIENGAFDGLPNLKYLNLSRNIISFRNLSNCDLSSVETLVLDQAIVKGSERFDSSFYRSLRDRGGDISAQIYLTDSWFVYKNTIELMAFTKFPKLKKLYLRQNGIYEIKLLNTTLNDVMPSITHLYLNDNNLKNVDFLINFPSTLTHLHLDNNYFIPPIKTDRSPNKLKVLTVDGSKIHTLCEPYQECGGISMEMFEQLEHFSISNVDSMQIQPNSFKYSTNLKYLIMSHNKIDNKNPNNTFHNLINLQTLILDDDNMNTLPYISDLKNLQHFSIAGNSLKELNESSFHGLSNLKKLNLSNNNIKEIAPGTFHELVSLEELDLSTNKLEVLPTNWITPEMKLKYLSLRNNLFKSLSSLSLTGIQSLQYISIAENPLKLIDIKLLMALPANATIDITAFNSISCQ